MNYIKYIDFNEMNKYYCSNKEYLFFDTVIKLRTWLKEKQLKRKEAEKMYNIITATKLVYIRCFYCNTLRDISFNYLIGRLNTKWFPERLICRKSNCCKVKLKEINIYRAKIGASPAQGHIVTETQKMKRNKTMQKRYADYKPWSQKRKGKTYEEQFGVEQAKIIKKKISDYRTTYQIGENEPHLGHKHSIQTKIKMSQRKKEFLQTEAYKNKYVNPMTEEMINYYQWRSCIIKYTWKNKTEKERAKIREKVAIRFLKQDGIKKKHSKTGKIKHWLLENEQIFDSSFEEAYFKKLNDEKKFWKKNKSIYIPYIHPKDNEKHYYCPDVLLYNDNKFLNLYAIVEVKPSEFILNPNNNEGLYYKITQVKLKELQKYCLNQKIESIIITEKDLGDYIENKKNNKN